MGGEATKFLDNVIDYETRVYWALNKNPNRLSVQKGKEHLVDMLFKLNCAPALSSGTLSRRNVPGIGEGDVPNIIRYLPQGLGWGINDLREKGVSDDKIYDRLIESRDYALKERRVSIHDFILKEKAVGVYDSTKKGLESFREIIV